jgi:hypothetical protein
MIPTSVAVDPLEGVTILRLHAAESARVLMIPISVAVALLVEIVEMNHATVNAVKNAAAKQERRAAGSLGTSAVRVLRRLGDEIAMKLKAVAQT